MVEFCPILLSVSLISEISMSRGNVCSENETQPGGGIVKLSRINMDCLEEQRETGDLILSMATCPRKT